VRAGLIMSSFLVLDLAFFSGANLVKIPHGGWFSAAGGPDWSTS